MNIMRLRQLRYMIQVAYQHSRWLPDEGKTNESEYAPPNTKVKQHLLETLKEIDDIIGGDDDF